MTISDIAIQPGLVTGGADAVARNITFVIFEGMQLLDLAGPLEVFDAANRLVGREVYRSSLVGLSPRITSSSGVTLEALPIAATPGPIDTLVVVGGLATKTEQHNQALIGHVARLAESARRLCSVCTGAFLLAAAGLLDGRASTTHWANASSLKRRYPKVRVDPDPIFVQDGNVWTSAGVTTGIDLALALVADDVGAHVAADIARWLVLPARRMGLQSQYSPELAGQTAAAHPFAELIEWMTANLAADLSVTALAERTHLSERHFARRFAAAIERTPSEYVEALRLDAARRLLETGDTTVAVIARRTGFRNRETLHRAFQRRFGTSPTVYRQSFAA